MKGRIGRRDFSQFPNLARTGCSDENLEVYTEHPRALKVVMVVRFEDILSMQIPVRIVNSCRNIV